MTLNPSSTAATPAPANHRILCVFLTAVLIPLHYLLVRYTPWLVGQRRPAPRSLPSS